MTGAGVVLAPPNRRSKAALGEPMSAPGASVIPEPGSRERRRSVTSSAPHEFSPERAPPEVVVPKVISTSACNSIDTKTNRYSIGTSTEEGEVRRRTKSRRGVTSESGQLRMRSERRTG